MHCMAFTEPAPARLLQLTRGRRVCTLCYQFERTRCAARRIRRNTNAYYKVLRDLRQMEAYCSSMVTNDPSMLQHVVPTQSRSTCAALWGESEHVQEQIWQRSQSWSSAVTHPYSPEMWQRQGNQAASHEIWQRQGSQWQSNIWGPACDIPATFYSNQATNVSASPTSSPDPFGDLDEIATIGEERDPNVRRGRGRGRDGRRQGQVNKKIPRWPLAEYVQTDLPGSASSPSQRLQTDLPSECSQPEPQSEPPSGLFEKED